MAYKSSVVFSRNTHNLGLQLLSNNVSNNNFHNVSNNNFHNVSNNNFHSMSIYFIIR